MTLSRDEEICCVQKYIKMLIKEYELDEIQLLDIWMKHYSNDSENNSTANQISQVRTNSFTETGKTVDIPDKPLNVSTTTYTHLELSKLKKKGLQDLCKLHDLPYSGVKSALIQRLLNRNNQVTFKRNVTNTHKKKRVSKNCVAPILTKIESNKDYIKIRRNIYGNYEHLDTGFVFNQNTQEVIGKQEEGGLVKQLELKDVEACNTYNFKYILPDNLVSDHDVNNK